MGQQVAGRAPGHKKGSSPGDGAEPLLQELSQVFQDGLAVQAHELFAAHLWGAGSESAMGQTPGIKVLSPTCGVPGAGDQTHLVHHRDVGGMRPEAVVHGDESQALPGQGDPK